jgi:translation initiation factor IF-2
LSIEKTYRLNKVAAEFNVSWKTIIEHLQSKGFDIEAKITAKVDEEMYSILLTYYQQDKKAKEESRALDVNLRKEPVKQETKKVETARPNEMDISDEPETILIKEIGLKNSAPKQEVFSHPERIEETTNPEKIESGEQEELPQELPQGKNETEKSEEKTAEEVVSKEIIEPNLIGPKILGKIELPKPIVRTRGKVNKSEEKPKDQEVALKVEENIGSENESEPKTEVIEKPKIEETPAQEKEPIPEEAPLDEKIETKFQKLDGTTVLGNIEIPKPIKRERVIVERPDRKRKRKRIQAEKVVPEKVVTDFKNKPYVKKEEVANKDVKDKVKETLSKISGQKTTPKQGGKIRQKARKDRRKEHRAKWEEKQLQEQIESKILEVTEFVTANELANMMSIPVTQVIGACMSIGLMVSINQRLDAETIQLVADEYGFEVNFIGAEQTIEIEDIVDEDSELKPRNPIVTVMGHVDHGKTSLLDYIRSANVIAGEAGGITQHVAAYEVSLKSGNKITFIDTPGHEAFTAMRARGAQVTDIAIIVIAADDAVMPQTKEAISHAQAAQVPMIFAFNKIDKPGANTDRIREQLSQMNILVEEWGGKYQTQEVSAKNGINIDELLEKVLLEAEMLELRANPDRLAEGVVIEAKMEKGRGVVASLIVQAGTLKIGDPLVAGQYFSRVKAMFNERGQAVSKVGPSSPVSILGFSGTPNAGETFRVMEDESTAKDIANKREQLQREQGIRATKRITLDDIGKRLAVGNFKELNIIIKADVDGSVEALSDSLIKLSTEEIQVNVIYKSVGPISENDVLLATASDAIIIGFQVRPTPNAKKVAENEDVEIRLYSVIYQAIEDVEAAMEGMLDPEYEEVITGTAEIRETFKISKVGTIAGCMVTDGKIFRDNGVRLIRDSVVIYTGSLEALKRYKDDVKEVAKGYECGMQVKNYNDIQIGDIIEGFTQEEKKRKLK